MSEHSPLIIARFMNPEQQKVLTQNVVRRMGLNLEELPLDLLASGQAYSPLTDEEQHEQAVSHPDSQLGRLGESERRKSLEEEVRAYAPSNRPLNVKIDKTVSRSRGGLTVISYRYTSSYVNDEYAHMGHAIDDLNGIDTEWRPLFARIILAVMESGDERIKPL